MALVVPTYPIYLIPHKDRPLALVARGPGPALEGGARALTAPGSHKRPGAGPLFPDGPTTWPLFPTHTRHTCRGRCWGRGKHGYGQEQGREQGPGQEHGLPVTLNLPSRDRGGSLWAVGARFPSWVPPPLSDVGGGAQV